LLWAISEGRRFPTVLLPEFLHLRDFLRMWPLPLGISFSLGVVSSWVGGILSRNVPSFLNCSSHQCSFAGGTGSAFSGRT